MSFKNIGRRIPIATLNFLHQHKKDFEAIFSVAIAMKIQCKSYIGCELKSIAILEYCASLNLLWQLFDSKDLGINTNGKDTRKHAGKNNLHT